MMYSASKLNKQGDNMYLMYSFPYLEPVCCSMSNSSCCFLICIQISQEAGQESSRKTSFSALLIMPKPLTVWITTNCGKFLKRWGIPDHLTCLLRNLYAGQEATVRAGHGTTDWFQIGKGVRQGCILSSCLFNLYAEYIMRNAGLEEAQAGIKIAGRNINNFRYADESPLWQKAKKN